MKTTKKASEQSDPNVAAAADSDKLQPAEAVDAISLIKNDHRKVETLFKQFEAASSNEQKGTVAQQICIELIVHAMIEEELFYPACRKAGVMHEMLDEAQVEHDGAKILINEILRQAPGDQFYDAKVQVLFEYVKHHVAEEEAPQKGILAAAQQAGIDLNQLGQHLQTRKSELMHAAQRGELPLAVPLTLHPQPQQQESKEHKKMDRYSNTSERDERGRFTRDDDDDGGRRYAQSERDDDRRYDRPRDERGRFESDEHHRRGRDDHYDYRRSRSYEDDDRRSSGGGRGWSGDPEGHSQAARRGWDEREPYRSRESNDDYDDRDRSRGSRRGWSGDPEGHAEAARRGWEERGSSRSRSDDEYNDRRRMSTGEGEGRGWYGDPRGHSEAARRGWDDRQYSSRPRSRDDDDGRRHSPRHDEGHGGWYGDSRGHAEAARRGWRDRDR